MRDFDEMLHGSFDAHAVEIDRAGRPGAGLAVRAVRDVRRRRAWRAGATGAIAATAVVGVVATAFAFTGDGGAAPAAHKSFIDDGGAASAAHQWFIDDPYSLGPCDSFIPANGALLPDGMYVGRAYVDVAAGFVVAVMPNGAVTRVQPGIDGDYPFDFGNGPRSLELPGAGPVVVDYTSDGGGGGAWVDADPAGWDWTIESLAPAPAGINVSSLYKTFALNLGFSGTSYNRYAIPDGAVAAVVATYADGHEVSHALVGDMENPGLDEVVIDYTGLDAVAMRVTLADGQVWEIRADYTPENVPNLPCQPTPPSDVWNTVEGGPLSGPESVVFQCGALLPANLQDTADVSARRAEGEVSLDDASTFDVGHDGLVIDATMPMWDGDLSGVVNYPKVPGWAQSGTTGSQGIFFGNVGLAEVVAVKDGVIIGAAGKPEADTSGGFGGLERIEKSIDEAAGYGGFVSGYNGIHALLEPCSATSGDLDGAQLAVIYGFGRDTGAVTYGWTSVTD